MIKYRRYIINKLIAIMLIFLITAMLFASCESQENSKQIPVDFLAEGRKLVLPYAPVFNEYTDIYKSTAIVKGTIQKVQEYNAHRVTHYKNGNVEETDRYYTLFDLEIEKIFYSEDESISEGKTITIITPVNSHDFYIDHQYPIESKQCIVFFNNHEILAEYSEFCEVLKKAEGEEKSRYGNNYTPYGVNGQWSSLILINDNGYIFHDKLIYLINDNTQFLYAPKMEEFEELGLIPYYGKYCLRKDNDFEDDLMNFINDSMQNPPPPDKMKNSDIISRSKYYRLGGKEIKDD